MTPMPTAPLGEEYNQTTFSEMVSAVADSGDNLFDKVLDTSPRSSMTRAQIRFLVPKTGGCSVATMWKDPSPKDKDHVFPEKAAAFVRYIGNCPLCYRVGMVAFECATCEDIIVRPLKNRVGQILNPFLVSQLWGKHSNNQVTTPVRYPSNKVVLNAGLAAADTGWIHENVEEFVARIAAPVADTAAGEDSHVSQLLTSLKDLMFQGKWWQIDGVQKTLLFMLVCRSEGLRKMWGTTPWDSVTNDDSSVAGDE